MFVNFRFSYSTVYFFDSVPRRLSIICLFSEKGFIAFIVYSTENSGLSNESLINDDQSGTINTKIQYMFLFWFTIENELIISEKLFILSSIHIEKINQLNTHYIQFVYTVHGNKDHQTKSQSTFSTHKTSVFDVRTKLGHPITDFSPMSRNPLQTSPTQRIYICMYVCALSSRCLSSSWFVWSRAETKDGFRERRLSGFQAFGVGLSEGLPQLRRQPVGHKSPITARSTRKTSQSFRLFWEYEYRLCWNISM